MFIPDYTITPKTLNNISEIEYNRGIIENTTVLPKFQLELEKETLVNKIFATLTFIDKPYDKEIIKRHVYKYNNIEIPIIDSLINTHDELRIISQRAHLEEDEINKIYFELTKSTKLNYRTHKIADVAAPDEILAQTTRLYDWYNSTDAQNTNQILVAAVVKGHLETLQPFETKNFEFSNAVAYSVLLIGGYTLANIISLEHYFVKYKKSYLESLATIKDEADFTAWIEFFTEAIAKQTAEVETTIKLLEKDSKLAKVTGRIYLTPRQERIITFIKDYGMLQNKHFATLFPDLSEDSILRDLKTLIDNNIIVKTGSTKSSRYELV